MKQWGLLFFAVCLVPCVGAQGTPKGIDSNFTNKVFKVKMYPGAKMIPGSSQRLGIDPNWGWVKGWARVEKGGFGRGFYTNDDPAKIEVFFRKQLEKMGSRLPNNPQLFPMMYKLKTGDYIYVNRYYASKGEKNGFEIYYLPAEKESQK